MTKEDKWAEDNNVILKRNSCKECIALLLKGETNASGERMFCSAGHAYEVSNLKSDVYFKKLKEDIFSAITGTEEDKKVIKEKLDTLENRYY